jgi:DNA invertase Pin-like site-specific DNA recombinase
MKTVACYIRVSLVKNNQTEQRRAINRWLASNRISRRHVRWYIEKVSDVMDQPKLAELQNDIREGRTRAVVVWRLDRLAGTMREVLNILVGWCEQSLRTVSVSQQIDLKNKDGKMISAVLRSVAQVDRETRRERTKVGIEYARSQGRSGGRPRLAADEARVLKAKKLQKNTSISVNEICKRLKISRSTYYRYVAL